MILEDNRAPQSNINEFINSELFGLNQGIQNELYVLQSIPVVEQTVKNLDLMVNYYLKDGFQYFNAYKKLPIRVLQLHNHIQPVGVRFMIAIHDSKSFTIKAHEKDVFFTNIHSNSGGHYKKDWTFQKSGRFGELIETPELAFIIRLDSSIRTFIKDDYVYAFEFTNISSKTDQLRNQLDFRIIDQEATVIEIGLKTTSINEGLDIVNELMDVYSTQNLNRKNHIADVTIDYIERQLGEISDSLSRAEDNLQQFRSSRQVLNLTDQASGMTAQYMTLQNQLAELMTRKRYYDYLADYINKNDDFSNMMVPAAMGIEDQMLNELVSNLVTAQAQRSNLIQNRQEKNPLVQRLEIQINNTKKTITENIIAVRKTTDISIDEMNKRINRIESEISRVPVTQRQLGGIERKYRLNDAIYNYLLEKRAEAKISQASNLPDNIIVEPANFAGILSPISIKNYMIAFSLGLILPFLFFYFKGMLNDKIEYQGRIDHLTDAPLIGKIPHTRRKTMNVVFEYPKSRMAEAFRALRTNIEYRFKEKPHKVILISSCIEHEGKSFNAMNLAMCYAQLGRKTVLVDFDLRKNTSYFSENELSPVGLSSYLMNTADLHEIIQRSPHQKLDYIPTGPIPPNPIELLASDDTRSMIDLLKEQYDCIIIDSAPLAQVSDAYLLMDHASIRIIVARYNYTLKRIFHMIMNDLKEKNIDNVCVILNDNKLYADQYGYGYGYEKTKRA
ncbi:MAG: polysaccharide biosynthesis tyrosine autokinase [Bacteroidales bacterium]|nr:polysaccharide biosynthesis tyrosine autokinase [Bacteroidales bacterium]